MIEYNIRIMRSFSAGKIWENPARIFCLSPVKSADEQSEESATCPSGMKWSEGVIFE
jgi:hypothetical protein